MEIALPDTVTAETLDLARAAMAALRPLLEQGGLPHGLDPIAAGALLMLVQEVLDAAAEDQTDLNPSEAAARLRMSRPSVMRLISRGELSARKDGGHYQVGRRELRAFQARLTAARREALGGLTAMAEEYGF